MGGGGLVGGVGGWGVWQAFEGFKGMGGLVRFWGWIQASLGLAISHYHLSCNAIVLVYRHCLKSQPRLTHEIAQQHGQDAPRLVPGAEASGRAGAGTEGVQPATCLVKSRRVRPQTLSPNVKKLACFHDFNVWQT